MPADTPPPGDGVSKPCTHCGVALQVTITSDADHQTIHTFICPVCGWQNSVPATSVTALAATIECDCGSRFRIDLDPKAARVATAETQQLTAEGPVYERMTITRSIINCPDCKQPHFVFGKARHAQK